MARQRLESGQAADAPTWMVETWLERCVNELWPVSLSPTTLDMHRHAAERWWVPELGQRRLETVTPSDVQAVITSMTDTGLSPNTVRINTTTMGKAMRQAVVDDIVTRNVVSLAQRPKIENVRASKYLTPDHAQRALALASQDHLHGDAVALSLWLGLRRGEALGLSWEAVDIEERLLSVGAMLVRTPDGVELKRHVKGGRSKNRVIPLPPGAVEVLERRKRRQAEDRLRAGEAWLGGMPMKVAQVILGHSTIAMTADAYTHVMDGGHDRRSGGNGPGAGGAVSGSEIATLVVAVVGVVRGLVSLGWQVKTHRDGGVRVRVSLVLELFNSSVVSKVDGKKSNPVFEKDEPRFLGVLVQNTGRQQTIVTNVPVGT